MDAVDHFGTPHVKVGERAPLNAWVAARVVLVQCPDNPANPNGVLSPSLDFAGRLLDSHPTLKSVEGPFVNGIIALTWEDDPAADDELAVRSGELVHAEVDWPRLPPERARRVPGDETTRTEVDS